MENNRAPTASPRMDKPLIPHKDQAPHTTMTNAVIPFAYLTKTPERANATAVR